MAATYFGWCEMNVGPTRSTTVSFLALRPCSASHFFDDICLHHSPQQLQSDISPHVRMAKYCDERVCVFVCPWAYIQNCMSDLHQIFVYLTQFFLFYNFLCILSCVSYLLCIFVPFWRRCNMLCTSGFMDDENFRLSNMTARLPDAKLNSVVKTDRNRKNIHTKKVWELGLNKQQNLHW